MKKLQFLFLTLAFAAGIGIGIYFFDSGVDAATSEPGTVGDPLVTKSYVDLRTTEIKTQLEALIKAGAVEDSASSGDQAPVDMVEIYKYLDEQLKEMTAAQFIVVEVEKDQRIIGGASTEMILRGGSATLLANEFGDGLSDLTTGIDLKDKTLVPLNHHLLVPRDDGRGLLITSTKAWIMVKGEYDIYNPF